MARKSSTRRYQLTKARCSVCAHPDRMLIEMARIAGVSLDNVATKYDVGRDAVWRHMEHLPPDRRAMLIADVPMQELVERASAEGMGLLDYLSVIRSTLISQMLAAAACNDRHATANLAGKATDVLREVGKLTGELLESARSITTINNVTQNAVTFMASPLFGQLETMLMRRLAPHPEALKSVVEGLAELEGTLPGPAIDGVSLPVAEGFRADAA